jgi:pyrroline-5-carboxylate reductase
MAGLKKRLGIIGFGNMGSAIALGAQELFSVSVFDKDSLKLQASGEVQTRDSLEQLVNDSDIVLLAAKPQDFEALLGLLKDIVGDRLIISIAAGITTAYIESILGKARVVRVMPNMGVKISAAQTGLARGSYAEDEDVSLASELFGVLGKVWLLDESLIDSITAISGSGPAYIFYDIEKNGFDPLNVPVGRKNQYVQWLKQAAVDVGFDPSTALELAVCTTASSIALLAKTGKAPAQLRQMITSRAGTTEEALKVLSENGSWSDAARAARRRAQELSK